VRVHRGVIEASDNVQVYNLVPMQVGHGSRNTCGNMQATVPTQLDGRVSKYLFQAPTCCANNSNESIQVSLNDGDDGGGSGSGGGSGGRGWWYLGRVGA